MYAWRKCTLFCVKKVCGMFAGLRKISTFASAIAEIAQLVEHNLNDNKDFSLFPSPCYIMEEGLLRKNLALIKSVADRAGVEIILAFKSFAMWRSFPIFREYIDHSTASSVYEARLALEEFGSKAHTYSPAYTEVDFPEIMRCSSHITFNSLAQFQRFYPVIQATGQGISCGIRINPEYSEVETELYNPCAPGTRFGVMADQLPEELPAGIEGFHCHCHCESSSYELERTLEHLKESSPAGFSQIKWLNLGGGHLMTRKDYDVEHLVRLLQGLKERYPHFQIILEPGSAFTWQTGVLSFRDSGHRGKPRHPYRHSQRQLYVPHARLSGNALSACRPWSGDGRWRCVRLSAGRQLLPERRLYGTVEF